MFYSLRIAEQKDVGALKEFIGQAGLSTNGIENMIEQFVLLECDERDIVGCIGIEMIKKDGLLRSFVASKHINEAHLVTLWQSIDLLVKHKNIQKIYLVTHTGASSEFLKLVGFKPIHIDQVPKHIENHQHLQTMMHNETAVVMVK
ncbi:hypothetical protein [Bacillus sp. FJAT-47783]|uniref:GNAT family N-acetyltransferase n=1 Tax=Bacillus sp. FJAT-47783 TaxID=2922712 RepID=UPI001FADDDEE|nr:hypothetical protein [Bacillus sp. FJAT-47783]